ncbi:MULTISPECIES: hypothetical protein [unclassified Burkholderia]|uniref:hypothetical protein n=1 Tax=unclassified Burkholderia TaxID=2613784 RepID=UPI002AB1E5BF|nr:MULTISPECIES: hypothetical protein [unclassified Burkholderia]
MGKLAPGVSALFNLTVLERQAEGRAGKTQAITYQVGDLLRIDPADPEFAEVGPAIALALSESTRDESRVYAVWTGQEHGSELIAIAYQGDVFGKR